MRPLTLDDLLPLDEFTSRRGEFFDSLSHYQDRYRRVRVGPRLALLFVNRQILWFHIQELLRVVRLNEPERVQQELDLYNRHLPGPALLQAALLIELENQSRPSEELSFWAGIGDGTVQLRLDERQIPAHLVTARPEDRCVGAAHWVQFSVDSAARRLLGDLRVPACIEAAYEDYRHQSPLLSDDVRQSLLEDLLSSDKDGK